LKLLTILSEYNQVLIYFVKFKDDYKHGRSFISQCDRNVK